MAYQSPVEADSLADLPPAYVEVAEFDCLHDDGGLYAELLQNTGTEVEFHKVKGAMHGSDTVFNAPTTQKTIAKRVAYKNACFKEAL